MLPTGAMRGFPWRVLNSEDVRITVPGVAWSQLVKVYKSILFTSSVDKTHTRTHTQHTHTSEIQCPDPGVPQNGRRLGDTFDVGSSVLFNCSDGFQRDGMSVLLCLPNGTWSHPTPTCFLPTTSNSRRRRGTYAHDGCMNLAECRE